MYVCTYAYRAIPPPTGFGSEEDSLGSCTGSLENRPPAMKVFGENKAYIFKARLANGGPDDEDREFVLTYYFVDGSVKVTEPVKRNSGFVGGVFMARKRVSMAGGAYVNDSCLYVGARVWLHTAILQCIYMNILYTTQLYALFITLLCT